MQVNNEKYYRLNCFELEPFIFLCHCNINIG
jgi:hypothetical protein